MSIKMHATPVKVTPEDGPVDLEVIIGNGHPGVITAVTSPGEILAENVPFQIVDVAVGLGSKLKANTVTLIVTTTTNRIENMDKPIVVTYTINGKEPIQSDREDEDGVTIIRIFEFAD